MKPFLLIILLFAFALGDAQTLPPSFAATFKARGLDKKYILGAFLKPQYLQADFNGDAIGDIAVPVMEKGTRKKGFLIIHGKTGAYFVFGAGTAINDTDNFTWVDKWNVYRKKTAYETLFHQQSGDIIGAKEVRLNRPAVLLEDYEDGAALAGGIIYWNGKKYMWIHQGE